MRRTIAALGAALLVFGVWASSASALDNGLAKTPPMGWNDWNAFGCGVSAQLVEQTADAMVANGMRDAGYQYVNIDDCWAQPERDANGNLVPSPTKFPDGIEAVADYVHARGLKLGIYEDSGTRTCSRSGGFPGSLGHEYQDALQFAQWGVDYLKYDDCNVPPDGQNIPSTIQRYETMRDALQAARDQTGHPIVYSICEKGDFGVPDSAWPTVGNLWRTTGDIHDTYARMVQLFKENVVEPELAGPGGWNDPDMLEVGNGGMTDAENKSEFSLWAEMAAPLIAGTDLRDASAATRAIYTNKEVIAVDQDKLGKQGFAISSAGGHWVLTKPLANGDRAVALFNETDSPATIGTTASAVGLGKAASYRLRDLWEHSTTETAGTISAVVPAHATVMYRVSAGGDPGAVPPHTTFGVSGLDALEEDRPVTVTETFTDDGRLPAENVRLKLDAPADWTVRATSQTTFGAVPSGRTVTATWEVTEPKPSTPFGKATLTASATFTWGDDGESATDSYSQTVERTSPVEPPYRTFASTDATFGEAGDALGIRADGADVYGATNQYGAIYLPSAEQDGTVDTVELTSQAATDDWAKAGIMVRNDISQSGTSPGFVILAATPGHGYVLQWDANGDGRLDHNSAPSGEGTGTTTYPTRLRLERHGTTFTGAYSTDGTTWNEIASADVPSAAASQDAGVFATSHSSGAVGEVDFSGLSVGPPSGLVTAPHTAVTLPGQATPVSATFYDHGTEPVSGVSVSLSAPDGWTVSPSGATSLGTVAPGGSAGASWQVMPPAGAPSGSSTLEIVATYDDGGKTVTSRTSVTAIVPAADLSSAYNNVGITDDDNTSVGNIDGAGSSLSAQALAAVGVTPGSTVTHAGLHFAWPDVPAGQPDNVVSHGQSFRLSGSGQTLGFLATATYGPAGGTGTITYTDGTTQQFALDVPDWFSNPPSGSDPAITMTYRNRSGNTQQAHAINVFYVGVPLQPGKTPSGVVLPDVSATATSGVPALHIFSLALG